jgi:hypothetical protein
MVVAGVSASMPANNLILKSGFSGPFSWTRSTPCSASFNLVVNDSRSQVLFRVWGWVGGDYVDAMCQEQCGPARADDSGSNDGDTTDSIL